MLCCNQKHHNMWERWETNIHFRRQSYCLTPQKINIGLQNRSINTLEGLEGSICLGKQKFPFLSLYVIPKKEVHSKWQLGNETAAKPRANLMIKIGKPARGYVQEEVTVATGAKSEKVEKRRSLYLSHNFHNIVLFWGQRNTFSLVIACDRQTPMQSPAKSLLQMTCWA